MSGSQGSPDAVNTCGQNCIRPMSKGVSLRQPGQKALPNESSWIGGFERFGLVADRPRERRFFLDFLMGSILSSELDTYVRLVERMSGWSVR